MGSAKRLATPLKTNDANSTPSTVFTLDLANMAAMNPVKKTASTGRTNRPDPHSSTSLPIMPTAKQKPGVAGMNSPIGDSANSQSPAAAKKPTTAAIATVGTLVKLTPASSPRSLQYLARLRCRPLPSHTSCHGDAVRTAASAPDACPWHPRDGLVQWRRR
jgi:hypothetical protein